MGARYESLLKGVGGYLRRREPVLEAATQTVPAPEIGAPSLQRQLLEIDLMRSLMTGASRLPVPTNSAGHHGDMVAMMPAPRPPMPRTIWVHGFWDASSFIDQLYQYAAEDPETDILVAIDSPGGRAYGLLAMLDAMDACGVPVRTCVFGTAMSAGFFLAAHGAKGKRFAMPRSTGMVHEISGWTMGSLGDQKADIKEMERLNNLVLDILAADTGISADKIKEALRENPEGMRDKFLDAAGLVEFGVVDRIAGSLADVVPVSPVGADSAGDGASITGGGDGQ
ncbi:ATP-dependent Clp protease proteolytic subunit [bacterium]|nr:ATP-dependent Clp protease proteolytic subunit [bacterium]